MRSGAGVPLFIGLLGVSGCVIGFDEHVLRGPGGSDGGGSAVTDPIGDDPPASPGVDLGGVPAPLCDDFGGYPNGDALSWWVEGKGTWRVNGHAFAQLDTPVSRSDLFLAWHADRLPADLAIRATVQPSDGSAENCVMVRVVDEQSYYALCARNARRGGHQSQQTYPVTDWDLRRSLAGTITQIAGASFDGNPPTHTLSLRVQGSALAVAVDGALQPVVYDGSLANGSAGIATGSSGGFTNICITPM